MQAIHEKIHRRLYLHTLLWTQKIYEEKKKNDLNYPWKLKYITEWGWDNNLVTVADTNKINSAAIGFTVLPRGETRVH